LIGCQLDSGESLAQQPDRAGEQQASEQAPQQWLLDHLIAQHAE
jgi:hypothetical protein